MNASQLVSYDFFKDVLLTHTSMENGMPLHLAASAASGTVATTICAPADVVKSRVMNAKAGKGGNVGVVAMLKDSLKAEGPRFLFRGWLPAWSEWCLSSCLKLRRGKDRGEVRVPSGRFGCVSQSS